MPSAREKLAKRGAPPLKKRKLIGRKASTSSTATTQSHAHDARTSSGSKLPKPLGPKARRIITKKTSNLMRKRNELDRALLQQAFRPVDELSVNDWLPREEILRQCERLASREREYIRVRTKALEDRTALYNQDPSEERALDLNLIRTQLWKFKRHLGPYLEAAEEPSGDGEDDVTSSESESDSSDDESELVQGKADDSASSLSSEGNDLNGNADEEKSSIGLDGAFDDIRTPKKRKRDSVEEARKESQKVARKEQTSSSTQSTTSQSQSVKAGAPKRSKEMETSLSEILNSMSQTKSSQVSINGASKVDVEEGTVETTTTKVTNKKADRTGPKTPASSNSSASDGSVRPWYQRHAKAMMQPDFDDCVHERPNRRGPKSKQKRREYFVSGALPVPHLPSPKPDKPKGRKASTDGP